MGVLSALLNQNSLTQPIEQSDLASSESLASNGTAGNINPIVALTSSFSSGGGLSAGTVGNQSALDSAASGTSVQTQDYVNNLAQQSASNTGSTPQPALQQTAQQSGTQPNVNIAPLMPTASFKPMGDIFGTPQSQTGGNAAIMQPSPNSEISQLAAQRQEGAQATSTSPQGQPAPTVPQIQVQSKGNQPDASLGGQADSFLNGGLLQGVQVGGSINNALLSQGGGDFGYFG
jgi:hypothetical protein